ncbi:hypothetical protein CH339_17420 [Rhodobium orientis]|uniref:Uncharacterized protein n=1 Tax=Rhodobium orientis TaxID=34017 RepID=A0A327JGW9_9HYPH|nr:hypothetical protein CH339_17420 [Rhodobium orientis]
MRSTLLFGTAAIAVLGFSLIDRQATAFDRPPSARPHVASTRYDAPAPQARRTSMTPRLGARYGLPDPRRGATLAQASGTAGQYTDYPPIGFDPEQLGRRNAGVSPAAPASQGQPTWPNEDAAPNLATYPPTGTNPAYPPVASGNRTGAWQPGAAPATQPTAPAYPQPAPAYGRQLPGYRQQPAYGQQPPAPPAPAYAAPTYGATGYGTPTYGAAGYPQPAYPAPQPYGTPAYPNTGGAYGAGQAAAPGYVAPNYSAPGYGAPSYGVPGQPNPYPQHWQGGQPQQPYPGAYPAPQWGGQWAPYPQGGNPFGYRPQGMNTGPAAPYGAPPAYAPTRPATQPSAPRPRSDGSMWATDRAPSLASLASPNPFAANARHADYAPVGGFAWETGNRTQQASTWRAAPTTQTAATNPYLGDYAPIETRDRWPIHRPHLASAGTPGWTYR